MRDIYSLADRVVVWLGLPSNNSSLALSTLEYLGKQVEASLDRFWPAPDAIELDFWTSECHLPYSPETWKALHDLIRRPWFTRVWTLQEIQLANWRSVIQCGKEEVPWYFFRRAIQAVYDKTAGVPKYMTDALPLVVHSCDELSNYGLFGLLIIASRRQCTQPIDKIYGILGLVPETISNNIIPDYELSRVERYKAAFLGYTSSSQRLDLLDQCTSEPQGQDWPSWLPDWSIQDAGLDFDYVGFCSSGDSAAHWKCEDQNILNVTSAEGLTVVQVSRWKLDPEGDFSELVSEIGSQNLLDETLLDKYVYILNQGELRDEHCSTPYFLTLEEARSTILHGSKYDLRNPFSARRKKLLAGRRIIHTEDGHIELAPGEIREGDSICMILGNTLPKVVRKKGADSTFRSIGSCYIYGLMNGEALLGPLPEPWIARQAREGGFCRPAFFNTDTKEVAGLEEDPRLGQVPMPDEWERIKNDDPFCVQKWKHRSTGEIIKSDPRLLPQALMERGAKLQTIALA